MIAFFIFKILFLRSLIYEYARNLARSVCYYRQMDWNKAIEYYSEAYRYNPEFISAISTVAYCYEQLKDYKSAAAWYEKYLTLAKPGSKGYNFAKQSLNYLKGELFIGE